MLEIQAQTLFVASRTRLFGQRPDSAQIRGRGHPADRRMADMVRLQAPPDQTLKT